MEPGPELDALVAEQVMEWTLKNPDCCQNEQWWADSEGMNTADEFCPSTDIATAIVDVVGKLQGDNSVYLSAHHSGNLQSCLIVRGLAASCRPKEVILRGFDVDAELGHILANEQAKTLPHAICLAALAARLAVLEQE